MGPVWFQIEVCTTRDIKRVKRHKANNTTNNYGFYWWCSAIKEDREMMHIHCMFLLAFQWLWYESLKLSKSFLAAKHNLIGSQACFFHTLQPQPNTSIKSPVACSWKQLPLTMHENTLTQNHGLHLKTTTLCLQGFSIVWSCASSKYANASVMWPALAIFGSGF